LDEQEVDPGVKLNEGHELVDLGDYAALLCDRGNRNRN
jgi:hypothetical protein